MKYKDPHKQILLLNRSYWDRDETNPWVRASFLNVLQCRTPAKGARVYASSTEEKTFFNPCKCGACASCGYRAGEKWRAERHAALPNMVYHGITFSMPDVLWSIFHDNPRFAKALPELAAAVIQTRARLSSGAQPGVIAILHTFNGKLEFNSHVHAIVTAGGLKGDSWISSIFYRRDLLMTGWRKGVVRLLRVALQEGQLQSSLSVERVQKLLTEQGDRWWSIRIQTLESTGQFLRYAGRYIRRPPIAGSRISHIGNGMVTFWYDDKREHQRKDIICSQLEFIDRWAQHILPRYQHSVRNFGLFSPRSIGKSSSAILTLLRQEKRPRPKPRPWALALKLDFGRDPLVDSKGERMRLVRLLPPTFEKY